MHVCPFVAQCGFVGILFSLFCVLFSLYFCAPFRSIRSFETAALNFARGNIERYSPKIESKASINGWATITYPATRAQCPDSSGVLLEAQCVLRFCIGRPTVGAAKITSNFLSRICPSTFLASLFFYHWAQTFPISWAIDEIKIRCYETLLASAIKRGGLRFYPGNHSLSVSSMMGNAAKL